MSACTGATGQTGTRYTYAQLQGLWIRAGGSKGMAALMAAIAMAESGGCSAAVNDTDNGGTQTSWGLWQISDGTHAEPAANILSPSVNAQQAVAKYQDQGLGAWGTYTSGAYKAYMSGATTPDMNVPGAKGTVPKGKDARTTAKIEPYSADTCLFGFPGVSMPVVGNVGQFCILPKHTARAFIGFGLLAAGFLIMIPGIGLVVVDVGLRAAGVLGPAVSKAGTAVSWVAPEAGATMKTAGGAATAGRRAARASDTGGKPSSSKPGKPSSSKPRKSSRPQGPPPPPGTPQPSVHSTMPNINELE